MQYFAQDEAARLEPARTVYETLEAGSPLTMVPAIRNILGGFLFSGDDIYKKVGVLSGGERTRLAVARMLLRPANLLLLDEPTNHLDLDSKDVLLDALIDYGGTLIFVSHDRYFVERLATKIVEIGHGDAITYPGTYREYLWLKERAAQRTAGQSAGGRSPGESVRKDIPVPSKPKPVPAARPVSRSLRDRENQNRTEQRRRERAEAAFQKEVADLESKISEREALIKDLEAAMAAPGFYDNREAAEPTLSRHAALMWEVGDLMHQWEELQLRRTPENGPSQTATPASPAKSRDRIAH
jgi:ATP-binding cassette subfamily F protein 3